MFVLAGAILGAIWGALLARKRGGAALDMAQYAAGFAIALALVGLFATLIIDRLLS